jgi:hypothetical protein
MIGLSHRNSRGIRSRSAGATTASAATRSVDCHSPAMYDSPNPISPSRPIRRANRSGRMIANTGAEASPAPITVPSG